MEFVKNFECDNSDSENSDSDSDTEIITLDEGNDVFKTLTEKFDQHKLNHILKHRTQFKKQMRKSCFENDYNPFAVMEKYLHRSKKGRISVQYKQNKGIGRFFAVGGLSLQGFPREVRHTIQDGYVDIDVVNAHPVILEHLCKKLGIECKYLTRYITN